MSKKLELVGSRFGRLVVVGSESVNRKGRTTWKSLCDCGNFKIVSSCNLTSGRTKVKSHQELLNG